MKKISIVLILVLFLFGASLTVNAQSINKVVDDARLLSADEYVKLSERLDEISEQYQIDISVVTVNDIGGKTPEQFAEDYYHTNYYGIGDDYSGVMLLLSMAERDWYIYSYERGCDIIDSENVDSVGEEIVPYLSAGEYYEAFYLFSEISEDYLYDYQEDLGGNSETSIKYMQIIGVSFALAAIIALISLAVMSFGMKQVSSQRAADNYAVEGSFCLDLKQDIFLFSDVKRRRIETESSGYHGGGRSGGHSGGRSSGGGGKF